MKKRKIYKLENDEKIIALEAEEDKVHVVILKKNSEETGRHRLYQCRSCGEAEAFVMGLKEMYGICELGSIRPIFKEKEEPKGDEYSYCIYSPEHGYQRGVLYANKFSEVREQLAAKFPGDIQVISLYTEG